MEASDRQLLNRYTAGGDETAFRVLIQRHLALVHGVALRVTRNEHLAKDVAQQTFIRLAGRAAMIPADLPLPAWLHRVCRHLAIDLIRAEVRRKQRELASPLPMADDPEPAWSSLAPVVDQLVNDLPAAERSVLLLRFYCDQSHAAIASQLGVSEAVTRKRASRAIERLRGMLAKRGIATTAAALATLLPAHAAGPVPTSLAASVLKASQGIAPIAPTPFQAALLAMNATQKSAIAVSTLIFLMSAGYSVFASQQREAASYFSNSPSTGAAPLDESRPARTRTERRVAATGAERLAWLREILEIESPAKRQRELIALIDSLAPGQYCEPAEFLGARNKDRYTSLDEYHLFLAAWTKVDSGAALEHVAAGDNLYHLGLVLQNWAAQDPEAALAWARAHPLGEKVNESLGYVLGGIATSDMQRAVDLILAIPGKEERIQTLLDLWSNINDQADALDRLLPRITDPEMRERLVERCVPTVAESNPSEAVGLLLRHPAVGGPDKLSEIFCQWAVNHPVGAIYGLNLLPEGELRVKPTITVCAQLAAKDPDRAFRLLEKCQEAATEKNMATLATLAVLQDPPGMLGRIQELHDTSVREEGLLGALRYWRENRQEAAEDWITWNPLPESVRQGLKQAPAKQAYEDPFE